ncbi:MAG: peptidoglycan editing factor PgeF [Elusimicrobiota bacterium]
MGWQFNALYGIEENLTRYSIPHCVTTKFAGNMKNLESLRNFFSSFDKINTFNTSWRAHYLCAGRQVHGNNAHEFKNVTSDSFIEETDAVYTRERNLVLGIFTADCAPLFIADKKKRFAALIHAGWKGMAKHIIKNTVEKVCDKKNIDDFLFVFGPHIKKCCYEVNKDLAQYFELEESIVNGERKYFLDLQNEGKKQLLSIGVKNENIVLCEHCTLCESNRFFSYRSGNKEERIGSFISL